MNKQQTSPATKIPQKTHQLDKRLRPASDLIEYLQQYARERPKVAALCCLGIGFALGWKLKPW